MKGNSTTPIWNAQTQSHVQYLGNQSTSSQPPTYMSMDILSLFIIVAGSKLVGLAGHSHRD
jgi:hypothetical protein